MQQRPPDSDDPTAEEESPEFDGEATAPLGDAYRVHVVTASESAGLTGPLKAVQNTLERAAQEPKPLMETGDDLEATGVFRLPKLGQ